MDTNSSQHHDILNDANQFLYESDDDGAASDPSASQISELEKSLIDPSASQAGESTHDGLQTNMVNSHQTVLNSI